jgi:hypothetical protein
VFVKHNFVRSVQTGGLEKFDTDFFENDKTDCEPASRLSPSVDLFIRIY